MQYHLHTIIPALRPYIKTVFSMEGEGFNMGSEPMRVLPDACVELFVHYLPGEAASSFLNARLRSFSEITLRGKVGCIAVCFRPGRAYPFFPAPMSVLDRDLTDLYPVWKDQTRELEDRIAAACDHEHRSEMIQQFLLVRLLGAGKIDPAVDFCIEWIRRQKGQLKVTELSEKTGLSNRQLIRRFQAGAGLTPKEFARLTRFVFALRELKKYPAASLTDIAYLSGYYDQAHFIHDFHAFANMSPGQLVAATNILY